MKSYLNKVGYVFLLAVVGLVLAFSAFPFWATINEPAQWRAYDKVTGQAPQEYISPTE